MRKSALSMPSLKEAGGSPPQNALASSAVTLSESVASQLGAATFGLLPVAPFAPLPAAAGGFTLAAASWILASSSGDSPPRAAAMSSLDLSFTASDKALAPEPMAARE